MQNFRTTPAEMVGSLWRNRALVHASAKREVLARYRGSFLGILWSFITPLFMLTVFTFVFSVIFQARWGNSSGSKTEFALILFAGLIVFNLFAECINRAPTLVTSNPNYVKKVVFPLETLPFISLLSALFNAFVSVIVWLIAYVIFIGPPNLTVMYLPIVLIPFCVFLLGLSWLLASLGTFLRDISQFIGVATTALMFLSPIFFPASAFPDEYAYILYLNPITTVVEQARDVLYWGKPPQFASLAMYFAATSAVAWLGFLWFQKTRKGFADVL
jgi:lipopolysaccharide transport system permease protein